MATIVNVQDPVSLNNLSVDGSGRIGINNWPASQTVNGTVSIAAFPAVQQISGTVDVTDRTGRQLGIVSISSGGVGTNTAPGYSIIQDGSTNANKLKVNADGSLNINAQGTTSSTAINDGTTPSQKMAVDSIGNASVNLGKIGGTAPVTGGVSGLLGIGGSVASGATNANNPLKMGGVFNTAQPTVTNGQVVDAQYSARGAALVATGVDPFVARVQGTSDGGVTFQTLKVASDGTVAVNSTLQSSTNLAGAFMAYREMVARGLVGNVKYLTGTQALVNNGGAAPAAVGLVDQNNVAYTTVTNGKTLYIAYIDVTLDSGGTTAAPLTQTVTVTISDGTNTKYKFVAVNGGPGRELAIPITLASATTLNVKVTPSNLATAVGSCAVSLLVWEE